MPFIVESGKCGSKATKSFEVKTITQAIELAASESARITKNPSFPAAYVGWWSDMKKASNNASSWSDGKHFAGIRRIGPTIDWFDKGTLAQKYSKKAK